MKIKTKDFFQQKKNEHKLIYLFFIDQGNINHGVKNKIFEQCNALTNENLEVQLCVIGQRKFFINNHSFIKHYDFNFDNETSFVMRIVRARKVAFIIKEILLQLFEGDILYFRYPISIFYLPLVFFKQHKYYVITEHNTIESKEFHKNGLLSAYIEDQIFGSFILKRVNAIIGVTKEITKYEISRSRNFNIKDLTIGNGINVELIPIRKIPNFNGEELHLLFVANISYWHGIDRILEGIGEYEGEVKIFLHIIGEGQIISQLKKQVDILNIHNSVIFHGIIIGNDLNRYFDQSHIAISSLGIHRKGLTQTSELKARDYCARGIPFILACDDPDFPDNFPFILKFPANEDPIKIDLILNFAYHMFQDQEHNQKMRQYAKINLDWGKKMKTLRIFLKELTAN